MNIFTALSQGKGRLNEENLSAMLAFLLTPTQTHGLGDVFLRRFLITVAKACDEFQRFEEMLAIAKPLQAEVFLEVPYSCGNKRRIIDIELQLYTRVFNPNSSEMEMVEVHRLAIENKVKPQAADAEQFKEEFLGILQDIGEEDKVQVTMIFLTPPGAHPKLVEEYQMLNEQTLNRHKKVWLHWADEDKSDEHIVALIRELLKSEAEAEISPVSEYLRHTLKAFVRHILESPAGTSSKVDLVRKSSETGEIVEVVAVAISDGMYQIERYESSTVRVFNVDTQEYEVARPILRQINVEKNLGIDLNLPSGLAKNTRILGREVMKALVDQGKADQVVK